MRAWERRTASVGGQQPAAAARTHLGRVVPAGKDVLAVRRDLNALAGRWELKVLDEVHATAVVFILLQSLLLLVTEPGGDVLAARDGVDLRSRERPV